MDTTTKLALKAVEKAESMGWETRVNLQQSDVLDWATVVAWAPGSSVARYIRFIEGREADRGSVPVNRYYTKLECCNCY
jgi:hypothetical protein